MKGLLAYKDVNGVVWNITRTMGGSYEAKNAADDSIMGYILPEIVDDIDTLATPDFVNETPAPPIQQEQLDTGAFPNEAPNAG